jgi:hypothetical protein
MHYALCTMHYALCTVLSVVQKHSNQEDFILDNEETQRRKVTRKNSQTASANASASANANANRATAATTAPQFSIRKALLPASAERMRVK